MKIIAKWILLLGFIGGALLYANSSFYSAWVSGGPPNDYPHAWAQRAIIHFGYAIALFSTGIMAFVALGRNFKFKASKLKYVWIIVLLLSLGYPECREFVLIDKCLDSGGAWDESHFECRH